MVDLDVTCGYKHAGDYEKMRVDLSIMRDLATALAWHMIAAAASRSAILHPQRNLIEVPISSLAAADVEYAVHQFLMHARKLNPEYTVWRLSQTSGHRPVVIISRNGLWILQVAVEWS